MVLLGCKVDWKTAKYEMRNPTQFVGKLKDYDKNNVPTKTLKKLKVYLDDERFDPQLIKAKSAAAVSLCTWCRAIYCYAELNKITTPKRNALAQAEAQLADMDKSLESNQGTR